MQSHLIHTPVDTDETFLVNLVLAPPHVKLDSKEDNTNPDLNCTVKFQIVIGKGTYGSTAEAARKLVETLHSNCYLVPIVNRKLENTTTASVAVELVYGDGYRTLIKRRDGNEIKSYKQIGVHLSLGTGDADESIGSLPILMPTDNLWQHTMNFSDLCTSSGVVPTLYVHTSDTLFLYPVKPENMSCISLDVPTKRGCWTGAVCDGAREAYPTNVPKGTVVRKRKHPDDPAVAKTDGGGNKKTKKEGTLLFDCLLKMQDFENLSCRSTNNKVLFTIHSQRNYKDDSKAQAPEKSAPLTAVKSPDKVSTTTTNLKSPDKVSTTATHEKSPYKVLATVPIVKSPDAGAVAAPAAQPPKTADTDKGTAVSAKKRKKKEKDTPKKNATEDNPTKGEKKRKSLEKMASDGDVDKKTKHKVAASTKTKKVKITK
jgi:hypothetical protein